MGLLAPLFLLSVLAIAVPWWLHRLNQDNPPQQDFPSTMLLEHNESLSSNETRLRFKSLFSLRALFVALLALLFAQPVIEKLRSFSSADASVQLLVVDTSFSQNLGQRWQRTKKSVNNVIDKLGGSDPVVLVSAAAQISQLDTDNTATGARAAADGLQPGLTRLDYGRMSQALSALISDYELPVTLHFFSDMQRSGLPDRFGDLALERINQFQIYDSSDNADQNSALRLSLKRAGENRAEFTAIVSNYGPGSQTTSLALYRDQQQLSTQNVELAANSSQVVSIGPIDIEPTDSQFEARLVGDISLPVDNSASVALPSSKPSEIAILEASRDSSASLYMQAALEADPRFRARLLKAGAISPTAAGPVLLIPDAAVVADRASTRLLNYLRDGGNALLIAGKRSHGTRMRQLLNSSTDGNTENTGGRFELGDIDGAHPVLAAQQKHWRELAIYRHTQVQQQDSDRLLVSLADGSPLLLERQIGAGRLLLLTTPLDLDWNNIPVSPLFVAFVIRTLEFLSNDFAFDTQKAIGQSLAVTGGTQVRDPDGVALRDFTNLADREAVVLQSAGIYTIENGLGTRFLSVSADPRESDIRPLDDDTLKRWQGLITGSDSTNPGTAHEPERTTSSLHLWLLPLLALLALIEAVFSHRHLRIRREV